MRGDAVGFMALPKAIRMRSVYGADTDESLTLHDVLGTWRYAPRIDWPSAFAPDTDRRKRMISQLVEEHAPPPPPETHDVDGVPLDGPQDAARCGDSGGVTADGSPCQNLAKGLCVWHDPERERKTWAPRRPKQQATEPVRRPPPTGPRPIPTIRVSHARAGVSQINLRDFDVSEHEAMEAPGEAVARYVTALRGLELGDAVAYELIDAAVVEAERIRKAIA